VAIVDLANHARVELIGADRVKLLNNLCTNDLKKLPVGHGMEAFLLDARGRIVDFVVAFQANESVWLDAEPGRTSALIKHLDRYIIREDVKLNDRDTSHGQFHVVGPRASETLRAAIGGPAPDSDGYTISDAVIQGQLVQVRQRRRSQYPGFDLVFQADHSEAIRAALMEAGQVHGIARIGLETLEVLRLEAGLPAFGVDFTEESFAQEIGRDASAISFTKGCYIGQETVARIDAYGHVNRLLRGLILNSSEPVEKGIPIHLADKEVGKLGTCAMSPLARKPIGMAVLRSPVVKPGTIVTIGSGAVAIEATVVELPFSF